MPLINCEVPLTLTWSKNCVITDERTQDGDPNIVPPLFEIRASANSTFQITDIKWYVVTLST